MPQPGLEPKPPSIPCKCLANWATGTVNSNCNCGIVHCKVIYYTLKVIKTITRKIYKCDRQPSRIYEDCLSSNFFRCGIVWISKQIQITCRISRALSPRCKANSWRWCCRSRSCRSGYNWSQYVTGPKPVFVFVSFRINVSFLTLKKLTQLFRKWNEKFRKDVNVTLSLERYNTFEGQYLCANIFVVAFRRYTRYSC